MLDRTGLHRWTLIIPGLLLAGCASTTEQEAEGVERKQLLLVSSAEVEQGALKTYVQTVNQAKHQGALNQNPQEIARGRAGAARLIPQPAVFRPDAPGWKWEVNVITSKEINAWCMPGGKIEFYTGLIETVHLTDERWPSGPLTYSAGFGHRSRSQPLGADATASVFTPTSAE